VLVPPGGGTTTVDAVVAVPEVTAAVVDVSTGLPEVAGTEVAAVVDVVVMMVVDGLP
jgi:hypothetical protein